MDSGAYAPLALNGRPERSRGIIQRYSEQDWDEHMFADKRSSPGLATGALQVD